MKPLIYLKFSIFVILLLFKINSATAEDIISPINDKKVKPYTAEYSFLIGGHLYGAPANRDSTFPAASLLGTMPSFNINKFRFFISLGDIFRKVNTDYITNFKQSFSNRLIYPFFNSAGNHDLTDRKLYTDNFGDTYYDFTYGSELFIILDSELNKGKITDKQLMFFMNIIKTKATSSDIKNIIILSHKLIWASNIKKYKFIYQHINSQYGYEQDNNFENLIIPKLTALSKTKKIFWFSGDIGCPWSLPMFYDKNPALGITFIATGLGDNKNDAILEIKVTSGVISIKPFPLGSSNNKAIESYNLQYWKDNIYTGISIKPSMKSLSKIYKMLRHIYFWVGVCATLFFGFSLHILRNRKRPN